MKPSGAVGLGASLDEVFGAEHAGGLVCEVVGCYLVAAVVSDAETKGVEGSVAAVMANEDGGGANVLVIEHACVGNAGRGEFDLV